MSNVSVSIIYELFKDLEIQYKRFFELIYKKDSLNDEDSIEEIKDIKVKIILLFHVIGREINKMKSLKLTQEEKIKLKLKSEFYDEKLIDLNNTLISALNDLKQNNNIFKLSSTNKIVSQSQFRPRHLINFTLRINKSYKAAEFIGNFLPGASLDPYPQEINQMKSSFLKFNFDESARLQVPSVSPEGGIVKKGSILEIKYPGGDKDVFFRYTFSNDMIPSYFSGELYNSNAPPILDKSIPCLKIVSCKFGFMDSHIKTISFTVTEEQTQDEMIQRMGAVFNLGAIRPSVMITEEKGFQQIKPDLEDESDSHLTPGSMYQVSMHRRNSMDWMEDDGL